MKTEDEKVNETKVSMSETSRKIIEETERMRSSEKYQNYGEYLYNEAKASVRKQQLERERIQRLEEAKNDVFTFRPQINSNFAGFKTGGYMNTFRSNALAIIENQEKECSFKPKINPKSAMMADQKKNEEFMNDTIGLYTHENLFRDAEKRRLKMEQIQQEILAMSNPQTSNKKPSMEHINRLVNSRKDVDRHISQLRLQQNANIDPETGRELFKPQINRPKSAGYSRGAINVFEDLYGKQFIPRKTLLEKEYQKELDKMANTKHINEASLKIAEVAKLKRVQQLFQFLDSDGDGYLNIEEDILGTNEERFGVLDKNLQEILLNVFEHFEVNSNISFEDFANVLLDEMQKIDAKVALLSATKGSIHKLTNVSPPKVDKEEDEYTFKPQTTKKSEELVMARRSCGLEVHEILYKEKDLKQQHLSRLKQAYSEDEMRECSFKPQTLNPNPKPFSDSTVTRLLSNSKKKRQSNYTSSEEKEIEECTFAPKLISSYNKPVEMPRNVNVNMNKSYSELFLSETTPRKAASSSNSIKNTKNI